MATNPLAWAEVDDEDLWEKAGVAETLMEEKLMEMGVIPTPIRALKMTDDETHLMIQEARKEERKGQLSKKTIEELEDGQEEENTMDQIRKKRILELKAKAEKNKFGGGGVLEVTAEQFEGDAKKASKNGFVIMLLYRKNSSACDMMTEILGELARKFLSVKFVKLDASNGEVTNFPLNHCPTVMVYSKEKVVNQFTKLDAFAGAKTNAAIVEWELAKVGVLESELTEDPRVSASFGATSIPTTSSSSSQRDSESAYSRSIGGKTGVKDDDDARTAMQRKREEMLAALSDDDFSD